jgi:phosphocarrier protein
MKQKRTAEIKNELGLHARAAAMLVKTSNKYKAKLTLTKDDQQVNGKSIMGVLTLAAAKGSRITLEAEGEDASEMLEELTQLIENGFGEK